MYKRNMKTYGLLSTLLVILIAAGCASFLTATSVISIRIGPGDINVKTFVSYFQVDLTGEDVWSKHRDKIKDIDNIGFEIWLENLADSRVTGEFYIAPYNDTEYVTVAEIQTNATRVLRDLIVDPGPAYIDWPTSLTLVTNLKTVKSFAEKGQFTVYSITPAFIPAAIHIDSATVIVTVTYGR
ncbi:MAG: hypothetical protein JSU69_04050 [Candidatus Zixiibacteriota bacterium]|nr:MAG: hypothetical protein JSU69_04050 [candidate division Zixibacteria bacterium]